MKSANAIGLTPAYQYRMSQKQNEKQSFLKNTKIKNTKETFRKHLYSDPHLSQTDTRSGGKYVFLGAMIFVAACTGGALIYAGTSRTAPCGRDLPVKSGGFGINHHNTTRINGINPAQNTTWPSGKKRREAGAAGNMSSLSSPPGNVSQIKECGIANREFSYKIISKPMSIQNYHNLEPQNLRDALLSLQERCEENIKFINTILLNSTHLFWQKLSLIFPFIPTTAMTELLENCRAQLSVSKDKISNHQIQFLKCSNDGSLGTYIAGMLRKDIYQLGADTLIYTNDFSSLRDPHSAISTILHEIKHISSGMADSLYFPYPATFLSQVESLAETIKNIFSDKNQFLRIFSDPVYDIYSNATTKDQVTTNSVEIDFYVKRTYPRDVATRKAQLRTLDKTITHEDYVKILQTRIFSNAGNINSNEALLFIGGTSINDIFYGLLEYVRHILPHNQTFTTEQYATRYPVFIDEFRRPG